MKKRALYRLISLAVGDADGEDVEFGRCNELPESAADQGDGSVTFRCVAALSSYEIVIFPRGVHGESGISPTSLHPFAPFYFIWHGN